MPQRTIQAIEYECYRCDYTWISRIEKAKPRHCSKCKHPEWDYPRMIREEKYLRNRVRIVDGAYKTGMFRNRYIENTPTCHKFLYCDPRPTEEELLRVLNADAINAKGKEFSTESLPISLIFDQHKMLLINAVNNITNNNNKNSVKE